MVTFNELAVGDTFYSNGALWIKQSSRTAKIVDYIGWAFYFGLNERVERACQAKPAECVEVK